MAKQLKMATEGFNEILLYTTPNGKVKVEIYLQNETIWLTQQKISDLFGVDRTVVTKHLNNIYTEGELNKETTCAKFAQVQIEGNREVKRQIEYYNLDAIISVGYRVNSSQATAFRIWATERLKEFIIKGFTMDDERLKNPTNIFGKDYFEEQLARIRDIRSSERRFYQKITDIFAQCSADYSADATITKSFFATIQNKLHWAITGQTAAEIIHTRANSNKENMGLTIWKNAPAGKIRKADAGIAKNYLNEKELDGLNRIVSMYLDFAELQANRGVMMYMKDWIARLDAFLQFTEQAILHDAGKVSHEVALSLAETEFTKFSKKQEALYESDFDKAIQMKKSLEHAEDDLDQAIKKLQNKSLKK
ncbi:MAG: cell filamentation protein Fic [Sphingobacteriia bacterium]|nr:MAG: cell filamentation protein Fic [Sphingobacteriia bacterium]